MKQMLLSILLVLFSLIGCQTLDAVDTITVRPTEITVSPTTEATQATVSEPEVTTSFVPKETEPAENETLPQETVPPETRPVFTQPATEPTEPVETQPPETEPASTEPKETEPPSATHSETLPSETEPAETEPLQQEETQPVQTEPPECVHDWRSVYHPEEGHWVAGVACACGWQVYGDPAQLVSQWNAHSASYPPAESLFDHGGFGSMDEWIVDKPAYDEWVCRHCGEPKP